MEKLASLTSMKEAKEEKKIAEKIDEKEETVSNKIMTRKRIQIIIMVVAGVLLTAGMVVFGILAFRG